jgi:membrane protein DedA with SNARE-associated domain
MIEKSGREDLLSKMIGRFIALSILGGIIVALVAIVITELTPEPYKVMVENAIITIISCVVLGCLILLFIIIIICFREKETLIRVLS